MTTAQIIAAYYAAAIIGGVLAGLLRPLTQWRFGTFVLGAMAGTTVYTTIGITMYGWNKALWVTPVLGLGTGGLALVIQDQDRGYIATSPRRVILLIAIALLLFVILRIMYWH